MFLSRSPLRISLAGGGTDLPSYYNLKGGLVISAAINKYIYVTVNKTWKKNFLLKYSEIEKSPGILFFSNKKKITEILINKK